MRHSSCTLLEAQKHCPAFRKRILPHTTLIPTFALRLDTAAFAVSAPTTADSAHESARRVEESLASPAKLHANTHGADTQPPLSVPPQRHAQQAQEQNNYDHGHH